MQTVNIQQPIAIANSDTNPANYHTPNPKGINNTANEDVLFAKILESYKSNGNK